MSGPVVEITDGKLQGKIFKTTNGVQVFTFKGIPYAKPPIGELRFAVPVPPDPWDGIRDATKDCNICVQFDRPTGTIIGDEDCLYLNVYTPRLPTELSAPLPVMVFFHGGGFLFGHGTDDSAHGPDYLIDKDVVIVSLNYRLGILGFLSLNRSDAPGNMGLRDQVQALRWVQKNIDKFGGDPNNVTIFGVSAGGASVEYLLLSPTAKGLYHKAIAHSGSSLLHWARNEDIKDLAFMIPLIKSTVISKESDLLQFLKRMSIKDLITTSMLVLAAAKWRGGIHFGFVPTIEKHSHSNPQWEPFICQNTYEMLSKGDFNKVPYMAGFCSREGLLMVSLGTPILEKFIRDKEFTAHLPFKVDDAEKAELEIKLKSIYLEGQADCDEEDSFAINFFSDVDFVGGVYVSTVLMAKHNSPVYFYEFSYDGGLNYIKKTHNINRKGACHGDDGGYLIRSNALQGNLSDTDKLVRDRMALMWTNFAKYSNPTPKTDDIITTVWEPIAETGLAYLFIDDKLTMKYEMYPQRTKLFMELYEKYN